MVSVFIPFLGLPIIPTTLELIILKSLPKIIFILGENLLKNSLPYPGEKNLVPSIILLIN